MANTYPPKLSPLLMTPEPHYIPGYAGYCPQYKYSVGQCYGKLTSKLLTDPPIPRPGQLLLQPYKYQKTSNKTGTEQHGNLHQNHKVSKKGQKLTDSMISGYTGFVPRRKIYFSKTFQETCADALGDFEREQFKVASKKKEMELINALQTGKIKAQTEQEKKLLTVNYRTPLKAITTNPVPYHSLHSYKVLTSPYFMQNEDPNKHFIPGYKGHVPHVQFLLGSSYPTLTNFALIKFDQMLNKSKPSLTGNSEGETLPQIMRIYPSEMGMMPLYTGHIPGYKYQFGHTFGNLTRDALGMSTTQKQILD